MNKKTRRKARIRPLEGERTTKRGFRVESQDGREAVVVRPATIKTKLSIR